LCKISQDKGYYNLQEQTFQKILLELDMKVEYSLQVKALTYTEKAKLKHEDKLVATNTKVKAQEKETKKLLYLKLSKKSKSTNLNINHCLIPII